MKTNNTNEAAQQTTVVSIESQKSVTTALLLTFFFGPLGMLYSTIAGGMIMFLISVFIGFFTLGFGLLITWPICLVWAGVAARNMKKQMIISTSKNYISILIIAILFSFSSFSQSPLNNSGIVQLHKKQISKDIIISVIKSSPNEFNLSVDSIIYLKNIGIPSEIINEMVLTRTNNRESKVTENALTSTGLYFYEKSNSSYKKLYPTVSSQNKSGGYLLTAMTYGIAKSKTKASIRGTEASLKISERKPTFKFIFANNEESNKDMITTYFNQASSPNEFMILKMDKKENSREFVTGTMNSYSSSSGIENKYVVPFDINDLGNGMFEVTPSNELSSGEYCFLYAGTSSGAYGTQSTKVYDFTIK